MYTTIIFDFFDVIRTDPYKAWLKKHGIERAGEYAEASWPLDRGDIDVPAFSKRLEELSGHPASTVEHEYKNTKLVDAGIIDLIKYLGSNYKIGLLSNASSGYLRDLLKTHGLESLFDVIAVSGETGLVKPSEEAFHNILGQLNAAPEEVIFIDDSEHNVAAADSLGIHSIHFKDIASLKSALKKAEVIK